MDVPGEHIPSSGKDSSEKVLFPFTFCPSFFLPGMYVDSTWKCSSLFEAMRTKPTHTSLQSRKTEEAWFLDDFLEQLYS